MLFVLVNSSFICSWNQFDQPYEWSYSGDHWIPMRQIQQYSSIKAGARLLVSLSSRCNGFHTANRECSSASRILAHETWNEWIPMRPILHFPPSMLIASQQKAVSWSVGWLLEFIKQQDSFGGLLSKLIVWPWLLRDWTERLYRLQMDIICSELKLKSSRDWKGHWSTIQKIFLWKRLWVFQMFITS